MPSIPTNPVDEYLQQFAPEVQKALQNLRKTIRGLAPDAEETISYQIPNFKWHGGLVAFAGFKSHCSFFPMTNQLPEDFKEEARPYFHGKSTLRFTPQKPLPEDLVKKIVRYRMQRNEMKTLRKKK